MYLSLNSETYSKQKDLLRMKDLFFWRTKTLSVVQNGVFPLLT